MGNVITAIDKSGSYTVYLAETTDLVETARQIHQTSPLGTAAIGRVLTGTGLMGLMLKEDRGKLTVQFKGDGPAREILATADGAGHVKGYISVPQVELPLRPDGHLDVGGSLGIGQLTVIKDIGLKEPYIGKIALASGEIAEDLTAYFFVSEQRNTSVALGVKVGRNQSVLAAGGMIIQMLPGAEEGAVDALEKRIRELPPITTLLESAILRSAGMTERGRLSLVLEDIFGAMPEAYQVTQNGEGQLIWQCDCSKDRLAGALMTIGKQDLQQILEEDGKAELTCQFCEKKYVFDQEELTEMLRQMK